MGTMLRLAAVAALCFVSQRALAQVATPDPDIRGPARRAAGAAAEAAGAPGVEQRIENRQQRRDARRADDPDAWRFVWHNGEWWYYTPENRWKYYRDSAWADFDANVYIAPRPRYTTGYRGAMDDTGYWVRRGMFGRRSYYYRPSGGAQTMYYRGGPGVSVEADLDAKSGAPDAKRPSDAAPKESQPTLEPGQQAPEGTQDAPQAAPAEPPLPSETPTPGKQGPEANPNP